MKNILLIFILLCSVAALAQQGSLSQTVYRSKVTDSTAAVSANVTPIANGFAPFFWNNQASTPHWDFWNGLSYEHIFSLKNFWPLTGTSTLTGNVSIEGGSNSLSLGTSGSTLSALPIYVTTGDIDINLSGVGSTLNVNGTDAMVGIGVLPTYKLDVSGTSNNQNIIRIRTDDGANILSSNESSGTVVFQLGPAAYGFFGSFGQNAYMYAGSNIVQVNPSTIIHGVTGVTSSQSFWGTIAYTGDLSPAQITANQNNYSPGAGGWYRLSSDASRNITGWIPVVADGDILEVHNVGSFDIVFTHEDTNSDAANRFLVPGGGALTVSPGESATWRYDTVTDRWRLVNFTG